MYLVYFYYVDSLVIVYILFTLKYLKYLIFINGGSRSQWVSFTKAKKLSIPCFL
jgi:hypothetical protein